MDASEVTGRINKALREEGSTEIAAEVRERIELFIAELIVWSEKFHLIGRSSKEETIVSQTLDSVMLLRFAEDMGVLRSGDIGTSGREAEARGSSHDDLGDAGGKSGEGLNDAEEINLEPAPRIADIGSGAGFPAIVWKILRPDIDMTLYERREKPLLFLERLFYLLRLEDIRAVRQDAAGAEASSPYDMIISKASGRLPALFPVAEQLLRPEGSYFTFKGSYWQEELSGTAPTSMWLAGSRALPKERGMMLYFRKLPGDGSEQPEFIEIEIKNKG